MICNLLKTRKKDLRILINQLKKCNTDPEVAHNHVIVKGGKGGYAEVLGGRYSTSNDYLNIHR